LHLVGYIKYKYTGDRNPYSNLPMTSIYSMVTRDPHHSTPILFTSLPSVTFLPSSHPQDVSVVLVRNTITELLFI